MNRRDTDESGKEPRSLTSALEAARRAWPTDTRMNPAGCPLLYEAAELRALNDLQAYLATRVVLPMAEELEERHASECQHEDGAS